MAQWAEFPTGDLDSRTARIQAKVETLYERGDYKRAHFIYSNELARQGDKYAQYMTGYMYLMGQGVEEDPVRASAWYRLAAERRAPEFIAARDQVLQSLNDEQRARSDEIYVELRKEYSDLVIIMGLLVEDLRTLKTATAGSRPSDNAQTRLDFVTTRLDIDPIPAEQVEQQVDVLWERVRDYLSVVDDEADGLYAAP
jgi:TPR repeat protein